NVISTRAFGEAMWGPLSRSHTSRRVLPSRASPLAGLFLMKLQHCRATSATSPSPNPPPPPASPPGAARILHFEPPQGDYKDVVFNWFREQPRLLLQCPRVTDTRRQGD